MKTLILLAILSITGPAELCINGILYYIPSEGSPYIVMEDNKPVTCEEINEIIEI